MRPAGKSLDSFCFEGARLQSRLCRPQDSRGFSPAVPASRCCLKLLVLLLLFTTATAWAGGPRFVTGTTFTGVRAGTPMAWYTAQPLYFTDPGALAATVTHAQADAMVAAAAGVWNVPTANLTLAQGGVLAEHVSAANAYFNGSAVVFPADVQATNYATMQIAIVYDSDGSVTDLLVGDGASASSGCRQSAVTWSVDSFGQSGTIQHAVIVLNGRCVGSAPQQLTQMQYQLARAFGCVLGLAWAHVNDNVFTGATTPTASQLANWPLMHPIDVICGPYTYQCMTNPFALRPDDLSSLALLYPVTTANALPGKTPSLANAASLVGFVTFPTGQGMELANVTVTEIPVGQTGGFDGWQTTSAVTGLQYQQNGGNPVTGPEAASEDVGSSDPQWESIAYMGAVPLVSSLSGFTVSQESINPLYTGDYALGPYQRPPESISGPPEPEVFPFVTEGLNLPAFLTMSGASASCNPGSDGTEAGPAPADPSGFWSGLLCATGHSSWGSVAVKANRTWTIETTALDEGGNATLNKAQPVLGVWNGNDPAGTLPTVAAAPAAMNALALGVTQLPVAATANDSTLRFVVADQFGAGRPDFAYNARILYADSLTPTSVGSGGGQVTIAGMGFRQGNQVLVNGVKATVLSWTANSIVANVPSLAAAGAGSSAVDVEVLDARTGGSTVMQGALSYSGAADLIKLVSAPSALQPGVTAATPFAVRVLASDGIAPVAGDGVRFAVVSGAAALGCGAGTNCVVNTDPTGLAQITLAGVAAGPVTVSATELSGGATVRIALNTTSVVESVSLSQTAVYLAAGAGGQWSVTLTASQNGSPAAGVSVAWTTASSLTLTPPSGTTGSDGVESVTVQAAALASGAADTVTGCAWTTVCASWTLISVDPALWSVTVAGGAGQSVPQGSPLAGVTLQVADGAGHPLQGAPVTVYQTVYAWEGVCAVLGPCASAPVLASGNATLASDTNGQVPVTPLQVPGQPQVVQITAVTGVNGEVSTMLRLTP